MTGEHELYRRAKLKSYADVYAWFKKARSPEKGRPYASWALVKRDYAAPSLDPSVPRMPSFTVIVKGTPVCRITPDNKLTMIVNAHEGSLIAQTLSQSLHGMLPISWTRVGVKRYRITPTGSLEASESWWKSCKEGPELFNGLRLDLNTHEFTNAKADMSKRIDSDARKVWLRAIKTFKHDMALRAKMSVFDGIADKLDTVAGAKYRNGHPDWSTPGWQDALATAMKTREYPKALLGGILLTVPFIASYHFRHTSEGNNSKKIMFTVNYLLNTLSVELRTRFGVFTDEVSDEKAE
jgi:hypothetical protein